MFPAQIVPSPRDHVTMVTISGKVIQALSQPGDFGSQG